MPLKVLVIDRAPPHDARQGNALIGQQVFRRLNRHELTLVCPVGEEERSVAQQVLGEIFGSVQMISRQRRTPALAGWFEGHLAGRLPSAPGLDLRTARRIHEVVARLARSRDFDVVHVRQLPMAGYARRLIRTGRLLELVDSETLGAERARPRTARTRLRAAVAGAIESRVLSQFDAITSVAEADAVRLRQLVPGARVTVVPNGVDGDHFRRAPDAAEVAGSIVFVGAMSYPPNVAAMRYFCQQILPRIRAARREVCLSIVGRDPSPAVRELGDQPGVEVTGEVDDVRPYLSRASLVVSPMVSGSGIKNKVLEAFAMARPVVSTSLGVEGVAIESGRHALVVDEPAGFATAVLRLLDRPEERSRLGREARQLVEERYTWGACARRYDALYTELAELTRQRRR